MSPEERIRELCAQLLRAEHPAVIETVAGQLHQAINDYVQNRSTETILLTVESSG